MTFKLFSCCIPVRGALRSTICDVQRRTFSFIPNKLHELLIDYKDKDIDFIKYEGSIKISEEKSIQLRKVIQKDV